MSGPDGNFLLAAWGQVGLARACDGWMRRTSRPRGSPVAARSAISCSSSSFSGALVGPRRRARRRGAGRATLDQPAHSVSPAHQVSAGRPWVSSLSSVARPAPRRRARRRGPTSAPLKLEELQEIADLAATGEPLGLDVRRIHPSQARKTYLCPGCQQEIAVRTAHVGVRPPRRPGPPPALAHLVLDDAHR